MAGTPDARQSQRSVSRHRRVDRRGRRAQLQSLQGQAGTGGPADQRRPRRAEDQDQVSEAGMMMTRASRYLALPAGLALWLIATAAFAQTFSREQDIADLRLGQRALVDDGSCPTGQIKEVMGSQMTETGVLRTR